MIVKTFKLNAIQTVGFSMAVVSDFAERGNFVAELPEACRQFFHVSACLGMICFGAVSNRITAGEQCRATWRASRTGDKGVGESHSRAREPLHVRGADIP